MNQLRISRYEFVIIAFLFAGICVLESACGAPVDDSDRTTSSHLEPDAPSDLVYEETKIRPAGEKSFSTIRTTGALTAAQLQRVARPYSYLGVAEEWIYDEDVWATLDDNGRLETGYRVTRHANQTPTTVGNGSPKRVLVGIG